MVIAGEIVLALVFGLLGVGYLASVAGGLANLGGFFQQGPAYVLGKLAPALIAVVLLWIPLTGCVAAVVSAPWARAYRDLRPPRNVADTFA